MASALDVVIRFVGDSRQAVSAAKDVDDATARLGRNLQKTGVVMSAAVTLPLLGMAKAAATEFAGAEKVVAQTNAVLKSTGGIANVSADQVANLAESIAAKSGMDDEAIASGENLLLTFTRVRNEAGKGNDVFNQATSLAADLSVAWGIDMSQAATKVGKALNDPIAGMSALSKVGVTFNDTQKETIKSLVESGDVLGAQKVILKELETQVGGSAAAYGDTLAGQIDKARETLLNAGASVISVFAPAIKLGADAVKGLADFLGGLPAPVQQAIGAVGLLIAAVGPLLTIFGNVTKIVTLAESAIEGIAQGFRTLQTAAMLANTSLLEIAATVGIVAGAVGGFVLVAAGIGAGFRAISSEVFGAQNNFDAFFGAIEQGKKAGEGWADSIIAGAKASADPVQELRLRLDTLRTSQDAIKGAVDSGRMSQEEGIAAWEKHKVAIDGTKVALDEAKQAGDNNAAAAAAQRSAIDGLAASHQGVANAAGAELNAISALNNAMLAAQGGIVGYNAAQLQVEQAQTRLDALIAGGSLPTSLEYRQAVNQLQQAQIQAAGAAFNMEKTQGELADMLHSGGVGALIAYRDSLQNAIRTSGDATGATQQQIDKVNLLIQTAQAAEMDKTAHFHAETREANESVEEFNRRANEAVRDRTARVAVLVSGAVGPGGEMLGFMAGGLVPGSRTTPVPAILHGGELVIPSSQVRSMANGSGNGSGVALGNTFNINVAVAPTASPSDVGAAVVDSIRNYERANGTSWRTA